MKTKKIYAGKGMRFGRKGSFTHYGKPIGTTVFLLSRTYRGVPMLPKRVVLKGRWDIHGGGTDLKGNYHILRKVK